MLFPQDPKKRPALWESLVAQLAREAMCCLIAHGRQCVDSTAKVLNQHALDEIAQRFRAAPICRVSSSRGAAISPHFAAALNGDCATIVELIAAPKVGALAVDDAQLRNDVETAVINLLYGTENIRSVVVPLQLMSWSMTDAGVQNVAAGLLFTKN